MSYGLNLLNKKIIKSNWTMNEQKICIFKKGGTEVSYLILKALKFLYHYWKFENYFTFKSNKL